MCVICVTWLLASRKSWYSARQPVVLAGRLTVEHDPARAPQRVEAAPVVGELLDRAAGRGGAVEVGRAHGPLGRALPSPYTILSGRFGAKLRPWIHPYAIVFTIAPFPQTLFAPIPVGVSDPQGVVP
jgi:hypothetical protein